jgi:arylsulfatase A-like enzyme
LTLAGLLAGCGAEPASEPIYRFADRFAGAEIRQEPGRVDFSATNENVLLDGWSWSERNPDGTEYRWSNRPVSTVEFFLSRPRDIELNFRCLPYPSSDQPAQKIEVALNGLALRTIGLEPGWSERGLRLPASATAAGDNRLEFRYARTTIPAEQGDSKDRRGLGVAWDWLTFSNSGSKPPTADPERGLVVLPGGTRADFYLQPPAGSLLRIPALDLNASASLSITIASDSPDAGRSTILLETTEAERDLQLPLPDVKGPIRLRLEVPPNPGATDQGFAVLSHAAVLSSSADTPDRADPKPHSSPAAGRPNIILYVIDALRKDHLGSYGYALPVSPQMDSLAAEGVLFKDALSQSSWTKSSMASVFTGLQPWQHQAAGESDRLPAGLLTLGESLRDNGYRTAGFSANGYVSKTFGFDRGFDKWEQRFGRTTLSNELHAEALSWLEGATEKEPYFLYIHTVDPHAPYDPPDDLRARFAPEVKSTDIGSVAQMKARLNESEAPDPGTLSDLVALYDAEIAGNDRALGNFLNRLKELGHYDDTLLILSSDHGEEFYEHGAWTHRLSLHSEVLEVPLILRFPGDWRAGLRIGETAQHVDLLPTVLDYLGLPIPNELAGRSLLGLIEAKDNIASRRPAFSHLSIAHGPFFGVVLGDWKLITSQLAGRSRPPELYHRVRDPGEQNNLASEYPIMVGYLTSLLRAEIARPGPAPEAEPTELDEETRRSLEALGYLQ